jgi:hypothetical protein
VRSYLPKSPVTLVTGPIYDDARGSNLRGISPPKGEGSCRALEVYWLRAHSWPHLILLFRHCTPLERRAALVRFGLGDLP